MLRRLDGSLYFTFVCVCGLFIIWGDALLTLRVFVSVMILRTLVLYFANRGSAE